MIEGTNIQTAAVDLGEALTKMAAPHLQKFAEDLQRTRTSADPTREVLYAAQRMRDLHLRYNALIGLAKALNKLQLSDPVPPELDVKVTISYHDARQESQSVHDRTQAEILNVVCVGDLFPLIDTELGILMATIELEMKNVRDMADATQQLYGDTRQKWEAAHPGREIRLVPVDGAKNDPGTV